MAVAETSISNPPPKHTSEGWFYNKRTCREVRPGLDAPRVVGSFPNSSWSEERYVQYRTHRTYKYVWFLYHTPSHTHCSSLRYIRRCFRSTFSRPKNRSALNTSLYTSTDYLYCIFSLVFLQSQ
jgi:hypothetical protein